MEITVAVRVGFDDNRSLGAKETGGRLALPIFRAVMLGVYEDQLAGSAPRFPREIEQGSDNDLALQVALKVAEDARPPVFDSALVVPKR